ncbi:hypothetical protein BH09PSE3_BH09PSE3_02660 [soil metagenome]
MRVAMLWHAAAGFAVPVAASIVAGTAPVVEVETRVVIPDAADARVVVIFGRSYRFAASREERAADVPRKTVARMIEPTIPPATSKGTDIGKDPIAAVTGPWISAPSTTNRLSGSAWALFRPDGAGVALGSGGTLGGSQAGIRIFYDPGPKGVALTARISAPLAMKNGREASVGVGIRGHRIGILLERRIALDRGARNAMALTAYGGVSDVALPYGLRLDGYAQAGIVGVHSRDRFADGGLSIVRPVFRSGKTSLSVGGAVSGGGQPGVARGDIGPEMVGVLPLGGRAVRITAGWRERVAGRAAPGSGPSLSIGFGF